jgi:hypothetical protein
VLHFKFDRAKLKRTPLLEFFYKLGRGKNGSSGRQFP